MLEPTVSPELAAPVPAAPVPVPDVPRTRVGSHYDAKQLRARIQGLLAGLERAGDSLTALLETAQRHRIFRMLEAPSGGYFEDWTSFCTCPAPWGLGLDEALLEALVREQRDPRRRARLVLEGPLLLQPRAAPRKGRTRQGVRGQAYSLQRLKRDRPDLLRRVADGELTIQAAAELAGHRPPFTAVLVEPMAVARMIVSRFDDDGQREVIRLVQHPQEIADPGHGKNPHWEAYRARTTPPEVLARQQTQKAAARRAHREAYAVAYRQQRTAARAARRTQATTP